MYIADQMLEGNPKDVYAMVKKASAAGFILQPYWHITTVPPQELGQYYMLKSLNKNLFEKAEKLGWKEATPEEEQEYLDSVVKIALNKNTPPIR